MLMEIKCDASSWMFKRSGKGDQYVATDLPQLKLTNTLLPIQPGCGVRA